MKVKKRISKDVATYDLGDYILEFDRGDAGIVQNTPGKVTHFKNVEHIDAFIETLQEIRTKVLEYGEKRRHD